jgi:fatty acyl-CoA reductase
MCKAYQKIHKLVDVLRYFITKEWIFQNDNVQYLWKKMSPQDKIMFKFDMNLLDWEVFMFSMGKGIRLYTLHEQFENLKEASPRYKRYGLFVFIREWCYLLAVSKNILSRWKN